MSCAKARCAVNRHLDAARLCLGILKAEVESIFEER